MPKTYTLIASQTLTTATASLDFNTISGNYTDLVLQALASNNSSGAESFRLRFNSDTGTNYSDIRMYGNGSTTVSNQRSNESYAHAGINGNSSTDFTVHTINIQNYSNSTTYKSVISSSSWASNYVNASVCLWRNTNAITSINISCLATFRIGSIFTLYGIEEA